MIKVHGSLLTKKLNPALYYYYYFKNLSGTGETYAQLQMGIETVFCVN